MAVHLCTVCNRSRWPNEKSELCSKLANRRGVFRPDLWADMEAASGQLPCGPSTCTCSPGHPKQPLEWTKKGSAPSVVWVSMHGAGIGHQDARRVHTGSSPFQAALTSPLSVTLNMNQWSSVQQRTLLLVAEGINILSEPHCNTARGQDWHSAFKSLCSTPHLTFPIVFRHCLFCCSCWRK